MCLNESFKNLDGWEYRHICFLSWHQWSIVLCLSRTLSLFSVDFSQLTSLLAAILLVFPHCFINWVRFLSDWIEPLFLFLLLRKMRWSFWRLQTFQNQQPEHSFNWMKNYLVKDNWEYWMWYLNNFTNNIKNMFSPQKMPYL